MAREKKALSFRRKLLLLVAGFVCLTGVSLYAISYGYTRRYLEDETATRYLALNKKTIDSMDRYFVTLQNAAITAGFNPDLQKYLSKSIRTTGDMLEMNLQINASLRMMYHTFPEVEIFMVIPGETRFLYNSIYGDAFNAAYVYQEDEWYKQAQQSDSIRTFVFNNPQKYYLNSKLSHTMVLSVPNSSAPTADTAVYMLVDFDPGIYEQFIAYSTLDAYGTLLLTGDQRIVYTSLDERLATQFSHQALSRGSGAELIRVDGEAYMAVYDTSDFTGWQIVTLLGTDTLYAGLRRLGVSWVLMMLVLLTGIILVMAHFTQRLTRPLTEISDVFAKVGSGDLSVRARSTRGDEFGRLADGLDRMLDRIVALMEQNQRILLTQKQTELMALQQQVNPHFIFNALSLLIGLTSENRSDLVIQTCENIGALLRYSLGYERRVHLCEEIAYTRAYLEVTRLRFEGMFEYELEVDPTIEDCHVLKLLIQPIVENAVMHGFAEQHCQGRLRVACTESDGRCSVTVADSGAGMPPEQLERLRAQLGATEESQMLAASTNHIGLQNVWFRLRLTYGSEARMTIDSAQGEGTVIRLSFPLLRGEEGEANA